ncbi:MAG: hypothetical protein J0M12_09965 [Deltaproteobacteria bacterium]|nr:hypothetical protein [Deltaproteobacteria bacterium]
MLEHLSSSSTIQESRSTASRFVGGAGPAEHPEPTHEIEAEEADTAGFIHTLDMQLEVLAALYGLERKGLEEVAKMIGANIASGVFEHDLLQAVLKIDYRLLGGELCCQGQTLRQLLFPDQEKLAALDPDGTYKPMPKQLARQLMNAQRAFADSPEVGAVIVSSPDYGRRNHVQVFTRDRSDPDLITSTTFVVKSDAAELNRFVASLRRQLGGSTNGKVGVEQEVVLRDSARDLDLNEVAKAAEAAYLGKTIDAEARGFLDSLYAAAWPEQDRHKAQKALAAEIEAIVLKHVKKYETAGEQQEALIEITHGLRDLAHQLLKAEVGLNEPSIALVQEPALQVERPQELSTEMDRMVAANPMVRMMLKGLQSSLAQPGISSSFTEAVSRTIRDLLDPGSETPALYRQESRAVRILRLLDAVSQTSGDKKLSEELQVFGLMLESELERAEKAARIAVPSKVRGALPISPSVKRQEEAVLAPAAKPFQPGAAERVALERDISAAVKRVSESLRPKAVSLSGTAERTSDPLKGTRAEILKNLREQAEAEGLDVGEISARLGSRGSLREMEEALIFEIVQSLDLPHEERVTILQAVGMNGAALEIVESISRKMQVQNRYKLSGARLSAAA